ncbi:hypothetical protein Tco_0561811 [Tanacetum coccineum]
MSENEARPLFNLQLPSTGFIEDLDQLDEYDLEEMDTLKGKLKDAFEEKEDLKAKVEKWHNSSKNLACQPKVWSDAPIIEEYESDSEDEYVSIPTKEQETSSFANQQVKTPRETVKNHFTHSKNPKVDKKELGNSSQRKIRPIWNNVQRVNNQNQFVPTTVLTRTGKIPVNIARASGTKNVSTARHSFIRQAILTSAAMKVNTVKPIVNRLVLLGEKGKLLLSPQQVVMETTKDTTGICVANYNVDPVPKFFFIHTELGRTKNVVIVDIPGNMKATPRPPVRPNQRIAKDVKETLRSDQDLSECLNTSSMKFKESTPKKHEVKQVQQSCLGEDCWELYIPDLVPNMESMLMQIRSTLEFLTQMLHVCPTEDAYSSSKADVVTLTKQDSDDHLLQVGTEFTSSEQQIKPTSTYGLS